MQRRHPLARGGDGARYEPDRFDAVIVLVRSGEMRTLLEGRPRDEVLYGMVKKFLITKLAFYAKSLLSYFQWWANFINILMSLKTSLSYSNTLQIYQNYSDVPQNYLMRFTARTIALSITAFNASIPQNMCYSGKTALRRCINVPTASNPQFATPPPKISKTKVAALMRGV